MRDKLIVWLRRQRAMGRGRAAIDALMIANVRAKNARDYLRRRKVLRALDDPRPSEPEALTRFAFEAGDGFLRPMQNPREITELIRLVQEHRPRRVLEIGTARGGTLFLLAQAAAPDATIVSVDLPYGINGGGYPDWKIPVYRKFAGAGQTLHLLRADSHRPETRDRVKALVGDAGFDLVMIDADHSYEGAKTDYDLYSPLAAPGGLIVLHDVLVNRFDAEINVAPLWNDLKARHGAAAREIIDDPDQGVFGLGVITAA